MLTSTQKPLRFFATILILLWIVCLQPVAGFYDDTHYSLMYYLCRAAGFTPLQSYRIASASLSIDYAEATEPVQVSNQLNFMVDQAKQGLLLPKTDTYLHYPRFAFHAFMDMDKYPKCMTDPKEKKKAQADIVLQRKVLYGLALEQLNPGPLMHFFLDEYSHAGYETLGGHWLACQVIQEGISYGPHCDYLSAKPLVDRVKMIKQTMDLLRKYMKEACPLQYKAVDPSTRELSKVIADMIAVNPPPMKDNLTYFFLDQSGEKPLLGMGFNYASKVSGKGMELLQSFFPRIHRNIPDCIKDQLSDSPVQRLADEVIEAALKRWGELEAYPRQRLVYEFDKDGRLKGDLNEYTLYSNCKLRISKLTEPVMVSVSLLKTRSNDKDELLLPPRKFPDPSAVDLGRLPVGDIKIEVYDSKKENCLGKGNFRLSKCEEQLTLEGDPRRLEIVSCSVTPAHATTSDQLHFTFQYRVGPLEKDSLQSYYQFFTPREQLNEHGYGSHSPGNETVTIEKQFKVHRPGAYAVEYHVQCVDLLTSQKKGKISFFVSAPHTETPRTNIFPPSWIPSGTAAGTGGADKAALVAEMSALSRQIITAGPGQRQSIYSRFNTVKSQYIRQFGNDAAVQQLTLFMEQALRADY